MEAWFWRERAETDKLLNARGSVEAKTRPDDKESMACFRAFFVMMENVDVGLVLTGLVIAWFMATLKAELEGIAYKSVI